jgi:hypothetical protein
MRVKDIPDNEDFIKPWLIRFELQKL